MNMKARFSNKINTQDLFFSNPMDHFLGNDGGLLNSMESGFSSSHGYTHSKNSKDYINSCSEELFSQPLAKSGESQVSNLEYQKYISQNFLFGKRNNEKLHPEKKKEPDFTKDYSLHLNERNQSHSLEEIKAMLAYLKADIKHLNSETSSIRETVSSMKKECSSQMERIATYEDIISNQSKILKENENFLKDVGKKEKETIEKLLQVFTKQAEEFKDCMEEFKSSMHSYQIKILDNMKRSSAAQTLATKKTMEGIKNHTNQILRAMERYSEKIYSFLDKDNEQIVSQNLKDLHTMMAEIKDSLTNLITSQKISRMKSDDVGSVLSKHNDPRSFMSLPRTLRNQSVNGSAIPNRKVVSGERNHNISYTHRRPVLSVTQSSVHTPLAEVIKQNARKKPREQYSVTSQIIDKRTSTPSTFNNSFVHNKEYTRCTKINVKRKRLSPKNKKPQRNSKEKNLFDDYLCPRPAKRITRQSKTKKSAEKTGDKWPFKNDDFETNSVASSQYLTVYEAAMAEYSYI